MDIEDYVKYLVCPLCGADLSVSSLGLICNKCNEKYEVRDGIPVLLPESVEIVDKKYIELYDSLYLHGNYISDGDYRLKRERGFALDNIDCKNKVVVDLGGGWGTFSNVFDEAKLVFCVDFSFHALRGIDRSKNIVPVCADIQNDFLNVMSDIIVCTEVLEHLENPKKCLKVCHGLLKDNGLAIISVPILNLPFKNLVCTIYRKITHPNMNPDEHLRVYSTSTLMRDLKDAGFIIEKIKYHNLFRKISGRINYVDYLLADSASIILKKE